jgi:hypothetical protein
VEKELECLAALSRTLFFVVSNTHGGAHVITFSKLHEMSFPHLGMIFGFVFAEERGGREEEEFVKTQP